MRIIFIGDLHGRDTWKTIVEKETFDLVIFAGDYVSSHEDISADAQIKNLKEILKYKEGNPNKVILLRGNHDLQHLGYPWAECSGLFPDIKKWMSRPKNRTRFLKDSQWIYTFNKVIFSHAGISNTWLKSLKIDIKHLENINALRPSANRFGFLPNTPYDFAGDSITQSCVWIRPGALNADCIKGYTQIVGHTTVSKITNTYESTKKEHIWLCDALPYEYLVVEGDKRGICIYPKFVDKPVIPLFNRYHFKVYLENIKDNEWLLKGDDVALTYIGVGFLKDHIYSVDPSGGPFLEEGSTLTEGKIIRAIKGSPEGYIFTLEDENKED